MEYQIIEIIERGYPWELVEIVNELLSKGWEPQGGVSVILYKKEEVAGVETNYYTYTQALIRRKGGITKA